MKKIRKYATTAIAAAMALSACTNMSVMAVYSPEENGTGSEHAVYNEYGAHAGLDENTQNASLEGIFTEETAEAYVHAGTYIISDHLDLSKEYEEPGVYYETTDFTYGDGLYVIIRDENSTSKFYTLIKSTQDLEIGEPFLYREGDIGGRLLDDKYTSTHMATTDLSYVSYDLGGGKLSEQQASLDENGDPADSQEEGFVYLYLVTEAPADYFQRTENEAAGYEAPAQYEDRKYMPTNNTKQSGENGNNWSNLTADDSMDYNDRITKIGGTEGDSNTRLYSYSGQNVIVAKFAVSIKKGDAQFAYARTTGFDTEADYNATTGEIMLGVGESVTLRFHTQYTSTWGRDGYSNCDVTTQISDPAIASYTGKAQEEGVQSYILTGLQGGTTTLTATLQDASGKFDGGNTIVLTVHVI